MKRYILLRDWPDAMKGDIYKFNGQGYSNQERTATVISKSYVECYDTWFEEIKEPERIEVTHLQYNGKKINEIHEHYEYKFCLNKPEIPSDKYELIKKTIEYVLNNDITSLDVFTKRHHFTCYYTEQDLEKAWNEGTVNGIFYFNKTFKDYLNTFKCQK